MKLVLGLILFAGAQAQTAQVPVISSALSWYSVWQHDSGTSPIQTCQGERRGKSLHIACTPLYVGVMAFLERGGECSISAMLAVESEISFLSSNALPKGDDDDQPFQCGEMSGVNGKMSGVVRLPERRPDEALTRQARDLGVTYFRRGAMPKCTYYFPFVAKGDPFFHVYQVCNGILDSIWEFPIRQGRPENYAHWTYTMPRDGVPAAYLKRIANKKLWVSVLELPDPGI